MQDTDPFDYEGIEAAVSKRLKPVCGDMSPEDFDDLVRTAALIQWKYEQRRDREARALFGIFATSTQYADGP
jgi:hypothetical protein